MPNDVPAIVADALSRNPEGLTARKLAGITSQSVREVNDALAAMEAAGIATRTPGPANGNRKGADVWTPAPPVGVTTTDDTTADDATPDTDEDTTADDTTPDADESAPADDTTPDADEPVTVHDTAPDGTDADEATTAATDEAMPTADDTAPDTDEGVPAEAPVSGAPVEVRRDPDLKVLIMAGVLGDHPDGVSAAVAISESGLAPVMGDTILAAMEVAGAARRLPADEDGVELWVRGDGDLATVDPANAPTHVTCPTCGHTRRIRRPSATGRRATGTGRTTGDINSDGSEKLGKNGLRNLVEVFMRNLGPGHEVTPHTVGIELGGRSSGACLNAMNKLTGPGVLVMTSPAPVKFALADNPPAPTREVLALMPAPITAGDATDEADTEDANEATTDEALAA